MQFLGRLSGVLCLLRPVAEDIRGIAQQLLLPIGDLIGVYIELLDQFVHGQIPWIAARASLALNSGEWVRLFRLVTSLQSLWLMMEEALI